MWDKIREFGWWQGEIWNKRKNGEIYPEWLKINVVKDDQGNITNYIALFNDISVIK
jgi:two-component system CheB/CheR fusion protein